MIILSYFVKFQKFHIIRYLETYFTNLKEGGIEKTISDIFLYFSNRF